MRSPQSPVVWKPKNIAILIAIAQQAHGYCGYAQKCTETIKGGPQLQKLILMSH